MQCEDEEQSDADSDFEDLFIAQGLSLSDSTPMVLLLSDCPWKCLASTVYMPPKPNVRNSSEALFRAKETRRRNREEEGGGAQKAL